MFIKERIYSQVEGFIAKALCLLALFFVSVSVNTTCVFYVHQRDLPKEAKRFRKF